MALSRVFVTGLGAITPLGNDVPSTWSNVLAGRSGIEVLTALDRGHFPDAIAGQAKDFTLDVSIPRKLIRLMDRSSQLGMAAAVEALRDAGLTWEGGLGPECGVVFGSGFGGTGTAELQNEVLHGQGLRRVSPFTLTGILCDSVSGQIAILAGAMGPNMAVAAAPATGSAAVGEAAEIIRRGDASMMVCGAAEAPLTPILFAAFTAMRGMAPAGDKPDEACRPFDGRRNGFVVAEGAGALVLESEEHARGRDARVYAELAASGSGNDAYNMAASEPSGRGPALAMSMALRKSGISQELVGYVNGHGTASRMNDRVETLALKTAFGEHAYKLAVSSTKSMTGHMMGAAGAVEAVFSVLALRDGVMPPTINYAVPDPDCDLNYVPNEARQAPDLSAVLSLSIGLGGHNAALVVRRVEVSATRTRRPADCPDGRRRLRCWRRRRPSAQL
jgi:3-oxoacyl-[acyl-carrier-protein] synthase II